MHIKSSLFCQSGVGQRVNNTVAGADTVSSLRKDVWVVIITNKLKNIHYHVKVALASGFVFNCTKIHITKVTKKSFTDGPNETACERWYVLTDIVDLVETELTKDRKVDRLDKGCELINSDFWLDKNNQKWSFFTAFSANFVSSKKSCACATYIIYKKLYKFAQIYWQPWP